ncbi:NERD domain-containing protein [Psychromonas sp. L1A2]|uniref:NERD domain-containing protein n=1 Tax=Psychromonas sp. L1A2 TaxID=2686356 RepID=UPI00135ADEFF|nr:NERD domain-containing protein [Psychromonas sp. L1A2]
MDLTTQIINALSVYWFILPLFILPVVLKSAWFKGILGEFLVNFLLTKFLPKKQYTLIKNITLPTDDGTTQIDHIVVSEFGLFVIETKNMKGWIFGSANQKQWTQKIFKYSGKFQNPLHQNYKHTQTLASCLTIPNEFIYSVVVFIGDSTFKTKMPENVTYARGCVEYIKTKQVVHFTKEQVNSLISEIETGRLTPSLKTNLAHNKHVKTIVESKAEPREITKQVYESKVEPKEIPNRVLEIQEGVVKSCPKCGSEMALRQAQKGKYVGNQFWGCTNFPKCRKVINL